MRISHNSDISSSIFLYEFSYEFVVQRKMKIVKYQKIISLEINMSDWNNDDVVLRADKYLLSEIPL